MAVAAALTDPRLEHTASVRTTAVDHPQSTGVSKEVNPAPSVQTKFVIKPQCVSYFSTTVKHYNKSVLQFSTFKLSTATVQYF